MRKVEREKTNLNIIVSSSPYKKGWIASQLGVTPTQFSNILRSPHILLKDKLKLEKLCSILESTADEIVKDS